MKNKRMRLVLSFMEGYRLMYAAAILAIGAAAAFSYAVPLVLRFIIDSVIGDEPSRLPAAVVGVLGATMEEGVAGTIELRSKIWVASIGIVGLTLANGLFSFLSGRWKAVAAESTAQSIREALYDHLQHLSYSYHVDAETGDLIQRCTSDVETIRRFLSIQFVEIGRALFLLALALPIMFSLHVGLTLVSLPIIPLVFAFSFVFYRRVQRAFKASDEAEGRLSTALQENLTGVRVVRAFARQAFENEKFGRKNTEYRDITYRLVRLLATYWAFSDFLSMLQIGVILIAGTSLALAGSVTIGTLVVFLTMEGMLLWPIRQMGRILADMGKASVAVSRIDEILKTPREEMRPDAKCPKIRGEVSFEDVCFSYDGKRRVIDGVSFRVPAGTTVAILGPTGSGKSSLVHLLSRLYDYDSGSIRIDGTELNEIDKKWIRRNVGIVLQEPFLYAKTIKENIALARHDDDLDAENDDQVYEAARTASVHEVIESFERGYETLVGERGVTLSGGQKQRVAIARALVTQSPILVFDDSLSAVDNETDAAIRKALATRTESATTFIISHRLTTLSGADMIIVLEDGRVAQIGTHAELLLEEGLYKRIWSIQNNLEEEIREEESTKEGQSEYLRGTGIHKTV
jgi:ATP-binding cassette subfamily B protein